MLSEAGDSKDSAKESWVGEGGSVISTIGHGWEIRGWQVGSRESLTLQADQGCAWWSMTPFAVSKTLRHLGQVDIGQQLKLPVWYLPSNQNQSCTLLVPHFHQTHLAQLANLLAYLLQCSVLCLALPVPVHCIPYWPLGHPQSANLAQISNNVSKHHLSISPGNSQLSDSQGHDLLVKQNKISFDNLVEVECEEFKHDEGWFLLDITRIQFKCSWCNYVLASFVVSSSFLRSRPYQLQNFTDWGSAAVYAVTCLAGFADVHQKWTLEMVKQEGLQKLWLMWMPRMQAASSWKQSKAHLIIMFMQKKVHTIYICYHSKADLSHLSSIILVHMIEHLLLHWNKCWTKKSLWPQPSIYQLCLLVQMTFHPLVEAQGVLSAMAKQDGAWAKLTIDQEG
ncbi:hypothetical protein J3A83DRAFT_4188606 [Scleroderma citrinum]